VRTISREGDSKVRKVAKDFSAEEFLQFLKKTILKLDVIREKSPMAIIDDLEAEIGEIDLIDKEEIRVNFIAGKETIDNLIIVTMLRNYLGI
jgi:hypothetical protein